MATLPLFPDLHRKRRGAFFTPPNVAEYLANWAIRSSEDVVLEPSCGDAAFLLPAADRLKALGKSHDFQRNLHGVDVHADSLFEAKARLKCAGYGSRLTEQDFFERMPSATYDAVIGNPPYVRYQTFGGAMRVRALEAALRQGVRLNKLASSWAAFTVHASGFLKPEGRLALVLPAELLSVSYASRIRRFLLDRFASVRLIVFEELVFPGVLEDVVLLLAEGTGGAPGFEVFQTRDASSLKDISASGWTGFRPNGDSKWTGALLPSDAFRVYERLLDHHDFEVMRDWGDTYLGIVTGSNKYFALSGAQLAAHKLDQKDVCRISPPGSRHLRGLGFTTAAWEKLVRDGKSCFLFSPGDKPSKPALRYAERGEMSGVHRAYKCSVRDPWWRINVGDPPDLIFTYMNHECPRVLRNDARVHILNSVYGVDLRADRKAVGRQYLPLGALNSVTLLGGEIVGRAYGGGLLKFEPTEAAKLPVPSYAALKAVGPELNLLQPQIGALLRRNEIGRIVQMVDRVLLAGYFKIPCKEIEAMSEARKVLFERRAARGRRNLVKD